MNREYSVIIPTHNEGQNLADTVATFARAVECCDRHSEGVEVVVVDDQSTDDSIERLRDIDLRLPLRLVQPENRCGTARARRAGVEASNGEMVINIDAHCSVATGWLHDFEDAVSEMPPRALDRTLFGPIMHYRGSYHTIFEGGEYTPTPTMQIIYAPVPDTQKPYPVMTSIACGHYMRRRLYDQIGGYLPIFMAPWGIDEEIGIRLWMMGGECKIIPTLHMETMAKSEFNYQVTMLSVTYNFLYMARLHLDDARFVQVMQARRGNHEPVDEAVTRLMYRSNISSWVEWMRKRRRRTIDDLFDMFGIEW